jgi:hypothetical protein
MAVVVGLRRAQGRIAPAQTKLLMSSGQINSAIPRHRWSSGDGNENVISFRPRGADSRRALGLGRSVTMDDSPVKGLQAYESAPESDDDYRYRMRVNLLAAIVVITLIVTGSWVLDTLANATQQSQTWKQPPIEQATR